MLAGSVCLNAQVDTTGNLWPLIERRLDQHPSDTAFEFILDMVRDKCDRDYQCRYDTYDKVRKKLERRFNLPAAIYVCDEMTNIAKKDKDTAGEAVAHMNLFRYYDAIGNRRMSTIHIDAAEKLFKKTGNQSAITNIRIIKLEQSLSYRKTEEVIVELEAILKQIEASRDTHTILSLHIHLIEHTQGIEDWKAMERHVAALERLAVPNPANSYGFAVAINAAIGRADLALVHDSIDQAERYYQEGLRHCEAEPSRWLEIYILHKLAKLEWERRADAKRAKSYLDKAQAKAEALEVNELLVKVYAIKAEIAEAEGRYADALAFIKKRRFYDEAYKSQSAGFDAQRHRLQLEKEQLAVEKENKDLELRLRKVQLRTSVIIIVLALLMVAALGWAYAAQRKRKRELAEQNELIRQQAERLAELDTAKSRFFANVSHELRTPLSLLLGPIGSLRKEKLLSGKQARLLEIASQSGKQLEHLITEILDLSKLEMGKMDLDEKPTALLPFFRRYFAQFESLAQRRRIDFSYDIAAEEGLVIALDQEKCRQMLFNLLSNAFKFTPAGGSVNARVSAAEGMLRLQVADSGPGIHPDDLPHLFDRYFQTTRPDKPAEGGTGIGLALCYEYAHLFGGKIEAESVVGRGATFIISFPFEKTNGPAVMPTDLKGSFSETVSEVPGAAAGPAGQSKPRLLVVEDNPDLQDYISLILSEKYSVASAENGRAALKLIEAGQRPALILSDLMMPVMDGYQLLERLKGDDTTRHIPVVMLTARADARDKMKALRIGVDDYLIKPFDEDELLVRIENLLKNVEARQGAPSETMQEPGPAVSEEDQVWLENFEGYVQQNLSDNTLSVTALAYEFAMSESSLLRQLKRLTGLSPVRYLQEIRLSEARRLLENRACDSVARVATAVGYGEVRAFARVFRQRFGKLPSEYLEG